MIAAKLLIGLAVLLFAAYSTLELQGEFTAGRQALLHGDSGVALARVTQGDPNRPVRDVARHQSKAVYH
jgi:hypothetical protein